MIDLRFSAPLIAVAIAAAGCTTPAAEIKDGTAVSAPSVPLTERDRLDAIAARVTIIRDDFGVPHVYGPTDADAVFGLLYAQAEDDFPRIERNYVWAIGRLAEMEGEGALYSDLRARLFMSPQEAEAAYAAAPPWLQRLCDAFADGLNYFLMTHPEVKPRLLTRFEPWMPFYFFEGSIGGDIEQIPLDGIEAFYSRGRAVEQALPARDETAVHGRRGRSTVAEATATPFRDPGGSNGFAIAPKLTRDGHALLLINPHTSLFFRGEFHVVSEEGLNAYGAITWGQFFVYQGFNAYNGWMHTSTYVDFIDEFVENVARDESGLRYRYGDEWRPVQTETVELGVVEGEKKTTRTFRIYRTHHGPVTHMLDGRWVVTRINWDSVNALRQSYLRMKTKDHAEFRKMMDIRTNSSNNTVYADALGNIAYFHGNFVPRRDPQFDYSKPVDGSNPATDWQGVHEVDEVITLLNPPNGWIQNANSTPFTAAGDHSPNRADFPVYMAPDAENFRGVHAVEVLTGIDDLTLDRLIEVAYDPDLPAFRPLLGGLIDAYDAAKRKPKTLTPAIEILRGWDRKVRIDSMAMSLAHFYGVNLIEGVDAPSGLSFKERIEWLGRSSPVDARFKALFQTITELDEKFGTWRVPWGQINRYQRLDGAIEPSFDDAQPSIAVPMASGRWGALASFYAPRREDVNRLYGRGGNSFVAAVEFGPRVRAKTLLAGGQSGDPASPHFADQSQRYADVEFKDAAFYRADVEARARRTYHPGQ